MGQPNPARVTSEHVRAELTRVRESLHALDEQLRVLPWQVDDWAIDVQKSGTTHSLLTLNNLSELDAVVRSRYLGRQHERVVMMAPGLDVLEQAKRPESFARSYLDNPNMRLQLLLPDATVSGVDLRTFIAEEYSPHIECRLSPFADRWFIVTTDVVVVRATPEGPFVLVQNTVVADLVRAGFDALWAGAVGPELSVEDALLTALGNGYTVEAAARTAGISPRTAHRRLAETMEAYGAKSLFSLGAAWQHRRR